MKHKTNGASNAQVDKVPPPAGRADDAAKLRSNRIASAESEPTAPDRSIELHRAQTAAAAAQSEKASSVVKAAKADRASSAAQTAKADRASSTAQAANAEKASSVVKAAKADRASSAAQAAKADRASSADKSAKVPNTAVKPEAADSMPAQSEARSADDLPRQSQSEVCPALVPHGPMGRLRARYRLRLDFSGMSLRNFSARRSYERMKLSLCAGWYTPGERSSQDRARLLVLNYTANIIANLIGGSFFTGLLLLMDADDGFIGTMSMIGVAANMVQMFAPLLLERFSRRKPLLMAMRATTMVINILVIGLIPLAPVAQQSKLTLVGICVAIVNFVGAIASPGITVWHLQSIPPKVRAGFFSLVTMTVGSVVAIFNLAGSALVDVFTAYGNEYGGLMALRIISLGLYVVDFILYGRIREYPYENVGERFSVRDLVTLPLKNKLYLRTIAIVFLWNVTANIPGSYYTVYLLKNLNVSYTYIMVVNMLNVPIVLLLTRVWSRISSGRSPFRILSMGMSMYLLHYIGLAFVTERALFIYPLTLIWAFIMAIGINLPFASIPYVNIPHEHQTVFIGFYSTVANFAALIGVTIGKYFIEATEEVSINVLGLEMVNKQYLLLLTSGLMAIAVVLVHRIDRTTPYSDE